MSFLTAIADDLDLFDGLEASTLTHRLDASEDTLTVSLWRAIGTAEAAASDGKYTTEDVRAHAKTSEVSVDPEPGDSITDASGVTWTIIAVQRDTLATRWRLICRRLDITNEAATLVTIQVATWAKSAGGAQQATWANSQTNVRAKIQRIDGSEVDDNKRREVKAQFTVTFEGQTILTKSHRIVGSDAAIYRVAGYQNPDLIGELYQVLVEEW